ncbi:hypothetical protein BS78_02G045200 [Paspalum vaginatum]|nr:hypothetical protein BS78_02G045200 [Paspalum vaginatum]
MSRRALYDDDDSAAATVMKLAVAVAEAAAFGARHGLLKASEEAGAGTEALVVGGSLSVQGAADAAAEGAADSVQALLPSLDPLQAGLLGPPLLRHVKKEAALGAAAGVRAAALLFSIQAPAAAAAPPGDVDPEAPLGAPEVRVLQLETVAASAAAAAWSSACASVRTALTPCQTLSWPTRLGPLLGASVSTAAALCPHFATASHWHTLLILGGAGLVFLTLMVGVAAVPIFSRKPDDASRRAGFSSFVMITGLFFSVLCYMLRHPPYVYTVPVGIVGIFAVAFLIYLWCMSERHRR